MKELKEFEKMGVTKSDILYNLSLRLYYDREWNNLSDSEFIECTTDMLALKFDNTLKGTALAIAREILYSLYPNRDKNYDRQRKLKTMRKANLFKCAQALIDAGYLESNPVPPRGRRSRVRHIR